MPVDDLSALLLRALATHLDAHPEDRERLQSLLAPALPPAPQLVTLDQCAAICRRTKRRLRDFIGRGLPAPVNETTRRGNQAKLYDWDAVRPWLEWQFGLALPERFPGA